MFNMIFRVSNDNEQFHDAPIDVVSSNIDQAVRKLDLFFKRRKTDVVSLDRLDL